MELNINVYQKAIETIVNVGYSVIQIFPLSDGEQAATAYYFLAYKFIPAQRTPTDDIQYNQVIGINITDLVSRNATLDRSGFVHRLNQCIEESDVIRVEFPNNVRWFKFASAVK